MRLNRSLLGALVAGPLLAAAGSAHATFNFTATGSSPDGPLMGSASITPDNGFLTVVLTDNLANPTDAGQLLSSIEITQCKVNQAQIAKRLGVRRVEANSRRKFGLRVAQAFLGATNDA